MTNILFTRVSDEKLTISSHIKRAYVEKCERGECMGFVCYGYKTTGGKIVKNADEQSIIDDVINWHKNGLSHNKIARVLNEQNRLNRNGSDWRRQSIFHLLKQQKKNTPEIITGI